MGLLDNLESAAMSNLGGSNSSSPAGGILEMIQNHPGGLSGLVQAFQSNGLGGLVNSWVSTGANQPTTAAQIQPVLGSSQIQAIAQKLGVSPETASATVAQYLPMVIDKLTPNGAVPEHSSMLQVGESILASLTKTGT